MQGTGRTLGELAVITAVMKATCTLNAGHQKNRNLTAPFTRAQPIQIKNAAPEDIIRHQQTAGNLNHGSENCLLECGGIGGECGFVFRMVWKERHGY